MPWKDVSHAYNPSAEKAPLSIDEIMDRIEKRYAGNGFSAYFVQESNIKAMDITDSASGKLFIKRPGMMRWEYEKPEKQIIITDGRELWIYRPEDNQVMIGKAPAFFGEGKGAGFLSDMKLIRKNFIILPGEKENHDYYKLKLLPRKKTYDLSSIHLSISKKTFDISQVITYNPYGDETRIKISNLQFHKHLDDDMFRFNIPDGTDVIQLD